MSERTAKEALLLEQRTILLSSYCDSIQKVLRVEGNLSVTKILVLSFLYKIRSSTKANSFDGRQRKNVYIKATCDASGRFPQLKRELPYFAEALALLLNADRVTFTAEGRISLSSLADELVSPVQDSFIQKLINECACFEDDYVITEMLRNV